MTSWRAKVGPPRPPPTSTPSTRPRTPHCDNGDSECLCTQSFNLVPSPPPLCSLRDAGRDLDHQTRHGKFRPRHHHRGQRRDPAAAGGGDEAGRERSHGPPGTVNPNPTVTDCNRTVNPNPKADSRHFNADSRHFHADSCHFNAIFTLQTYIARPFKLHKHKFDIRVYLLIASVDPLVCFYHDGYLRVNAEPYDPSNTANSFAHITNFHVAREHPDYDVRSLPPFPSWCHGRRTPLCRLGLV